MHHASQTDLFLQSLANDPRIGFALMTLAMIVIGFIVLCVMAVMEARRKNVKKSFRPAYLRPYTRRAR